MQGVESARQEKHAQERRITDAQQIGEATKKADIVAAQAVMVTKLREDNIENARVKLDVKVVVPAYPSATWLLAQSLAETFWRGSLGSAIPDEIEKPLQDGIVVYVDRESDNTRRVVEVLNLTGRKIQVVVGRPPDKTLDERAGTWRMAGLEVVIISVGKLD